MKDLFFPYYINKSRLLDTYAILNHGYSEYEELTLSSNSETRKTDKGEMKIQSGFGIFKLGGTAADEKNKSNTENSQYSEKKVQTITSILKIVLDEMRKKQYLRTITDTKVGDFVEIDDIIFQINSIKYLMDEIDELMALYSMISNYSNSKDSKNKNTEKSFKNVSKSIRSLCNGEEVIFQTDDYAIVGKIYDNCLYESFKDDLINSTFHCLCQVKRIYSKGTQLMKDTMFTKIKDKKTKDNFIKTVSEFKQNNVYTFDSEAVSEISNKPVYEIEIIALYK